MNPAVLLPPAFALIIVAVWIGPQRREILSLSKENEVLKSHIDAARLNRSYATNQPLAARLSKKQPSDEEKTNWKELASLHSEPNSGVQIVREMMKLRTKLLKMSAEELLAGLDEIAALDTSEKTKEQLVQAVIGVLAQKAPELTLDRFADLLRDGDMNRQLAEAFNHWIDQDRAAATAWMDRQIGAGNFDSKSLDGRSQSRISFEAALLRNLITTDPTAAAARLDSIPEDQRSEIFTQGRFSQIKPGTEKALAKIIRGSLPEALQASTLASISTQAFQQGGLEGTGDFLTEIEASPNERAAIINSALAIQMQRDPEAASDIEVTRAWIQEQAPDSVERLTGEQLGRMTRSGDFQQMAAKALEYQQASGSDDVLIGFIESRPTAPYEELMELTHKIADPTERERISKLYFKASDYRQKIETAR